MFIIFISKHTKTEYKIINNNERACANTYEKKNVI